MAQQKSKPLALPDTLRDLALIRASDIDLSALLPDENQRAADEPEVSNSIMQSHKFVAETRAALRAYSSGDLQKKNAEIQRVQTELADVLRGLSS
ncbi:hypothetical protein SCLCIDRAFT_1221998 [Scleroderma citrinum Foug A]|uniref:Uncharacterized protein n=1 Tax=Scleroderma citrinum Foug A TaxID=1036808 RepID=A0A0C3D0N9_9AGAM|nr:hypothetical protein SCLCIDRAFT_1221998 [Scleroderma citrinum Foug A]